MSLTSSISSLRLEALTTFKYILYEYVTSKPQRRGTGGNAGSVHASQARSSHPGQQGSLETIYCQGGEMTSLGVFLLGLINKNVILY